MQRITAQRIHGASTLQCVEIRMAKETLLSSSFFSTTVDGFTVVYRSSGSHGNSQNLVQITIFYRKKNRITNEYFFFIFHTNLIAKTTKFQ